MKEFHQFECNVNGNPELNMGYPLRMVVKCLSLFDFKVEELKKFLDSNKKVVTIFDFDFSNPNDPMYEKNQVLSSISLQNTVVFMKMGKTLIRAESNRFANKHPKLKELWRKHESFLNELLEKVFTSFYITNIGAWSSKEVSLPAAGFYEELMQQMSLHPQRPGMHQENVGQGVFPFFALLNSSCDRNVANIVVGNKLITYACRPIKSGSQLFRMYVEPFYNFGPATQRRAKLKQEGGFWCECEACKNDWPTYEGLRAVDPFFQYETPRTFSSQDTAKKTVARNNAYIDQNFIENSPTQEVYMTIDNNVFELNGLTRPSFYP